MKVALKIICNPILLFDRRGNAGAERESGRELQGHEVGEPGLTNPSDSTCNSFFYFRYR